jgi:hypothetical protein
VVWCGAHPLLASAAHKVQASLCATDHDWLDGRLHMLLLTGEDNRRFRLLGQVMRDGAIDLFRVKAGKLLLIVSGEAPRRNA